MPKKTAGGSHVLDALVAKLADSPLFAKRAPHAGASTLILPDQRPAPASLCVWAAFDNRYPWYLSSRRSDQPIADKAGAVHAKPMKSVLKDVCMDDIDEEMDDEERESLKERVADLAEDLPGLGVRMAPNEHPDRILWFGEEEGDEATMLWYEDEAFDVTKSFDEWVIGLFKDD